MYVTYVLWLFPFPPDNHLATIHPYICHVIFFIVLDLRLTKVGVQRYSFFYAHTLTVVI